MDEENKKTGTTVETNPQKKKGGKAKKIIITIVAIIIVIAIVVGVLIWTGVLDFNLSKKSKMVAGVDQLVESYTAPIDNISESAEENDVSVKVLDNISKDSGVAVKTEVSGKIDELEIDSLSSSEQKSLDSATEILNNSTVSMDIRYDGNESAYLNVSGKVDDTEISGEAVYNGEELGLRSEELSSKWIAITNEQIEEEILDGASVDSEEVKEYIDKTLSALEESAKALNIDEKTQEEIEDTYKDVLKDYINDKSKDIESEKAKVTVDGKEKSCKKLTVELKEKDIKELLGNYIDTFKDDETTQAIIKSYLEPLAELPDNEDLMSQYDQIIEQLDSVKDELDDTELDMKVKLVVYATTTDVYRTDIEIEVSDETIILETTLNKNETVTELSVKSSGVSVDLGKITIKSEDNETSMKIEASDDLNEMIGVDEFSIELTSKIEKSKMESTISVKAGSYGEGTVTITTNINKNEDTEYDESSKIVADINIQSMATAKFELNINTNIKASNIEIPSISDSVDLTDSTETKAYAEEVEENYNKLLESLSSNKILKNLLQEVENNVDLELPTTEDDTDEESASDNTVNTSNETDSDYGF